MPFKSEAQRAFLYAKHPEIASRWEKETVKLKMQNSLNALSQSRTSLQRELDTIAWELARRQLHERVRYFQPNGGQQAFITEISKDGAFIVVNGSGNGAGKTYILAAILS